MTPNTGPTPGHVGGRVHALRVERGLTLERLAGLAGLTRGYLSLLERDLKSPSLAALVRIADALQTEISALFGEQSMSGLGYALSRHRTAPNGSPPGSAQAVPLAPSLPGKIMEPFFLSPGFRPVKRVIHSGEELIVVLSGEIMVRLGHEEMILQANDSMYFKASTEHQIQSLGSTRAHVLVVVSRNVKMGSDTDADSASLPGRLAS